MASAIIFNLDIDQLDEHLDALDDVSFQTIGLLEDALAAAFAQTQAQVHVITGSLRGSGKTESDFDGDTWSGTITYGGASPGFPNNPVNYAEYERARGGSHDFFSNLHVLEEEFEDAVVDHLDG